MAKDKGKQKPARRVSDYVSRMDEVDEKIEIESIFDQEVTVEKINVLKGKSGDYLFIVIKKDDDDKSYGFSCGGVVIVRKLQEVLVKRGFPCRAKFFMNKTYFDVE